MTRTHFAGILLALLLAICVLVSLRVTKHADAASEMIRSGAQSAKSGDFQAAAEQCRRAGEYWQRHHLMLDALLHHDEPDGVETGIAQLLAYAECEDAAEFLAQCAQVLCQLDHIKGMSIPTLQNIL